MSDTKAVPPKMTQEHINALDVAAQIELAEGETTHDYLRLCEVLDLTRSLVSRDGVVVTRANLTDIAASLENASELMGDEFPNSASICAANAKEVRGWLTPPSDGSQP
jgi:hypothetical protein